MDNSARIALAGVVVALVTGLPSYLALRGGPDTPQPGLAATTSSRRSSDGQPLRFDVVYNRTPESIVWALDRTLTPEDTAIIQAPGLIGNDQAQAKIGAMLLKRGGVKIESDETENSRAHVQRRLVVTGQDDRPVLITGLRANILKRQPPLATTLIFGPPQGAGENIQVGLDLDARTPTARSFNNRQFLAEPYFAAHHISLKPEEQVVLTVRAFTSKCYCEWELLVTVLVDGKEQVLKVRDGDQPFRTTAFAARYKTTYNFDFFKGQFVELPPNSRFPPPESGP